MNSPQPEMLPIESMDQFVRILTIWHKSKVDVLTHMQAVPDGTEVTVDDSNTKLVLTGDLLAGFKLGIDLALMELGYLPFEAVPDAETPVH